MMHPRDPQFTQPLTDALDAYSGNGPRRLLVTSSRAQGNAAVCHRCAVLYRADGLLLPTSSGGAP